MALLKEWVTGNYGAAAIWKIEEEEVFFTAATGIESTIKNDKKRIEHLAGRYLLRHIEEDFPIHTIAKDKHDKPRVDDNQYRFSISHSWPYVAVVIDQLSETGIDIQTWHPRIEQIQHKFLSAEEQALFQNDIKLLTLAWCAKEAVYKWNGKRGVDFIADLPITYFDHRSGGNGMTIYCALPAMPQMIFVESILSADFACCYVSRAQDWAIY